jgi:hypothetical protein
MHKEYFSRFTESVCKGISLVAERLLISEVELNFMDSVPYASASHTCALKLIPYRIKEQYTLQ